MGSWPPTPTTYLMNKEKKRKEKKVKICVTVKRGCFIGS